LIIKFDEIRLIEACFHKVLAFRFDTFLLVFESDLFVLSSLSVDQYRSKFEIILKTCQKLPEIFFLNQF